MKTTASSLYGKSHLTVLARVKPGLIEGSTLNETYRYRAEGLLGTLHLLRLQQVEAGREPHPFPDVVGRHEAIHSFSVTLLPAERAGDPDQVLLDVIFDGGLEPYIRVIWGPLGCTLDAIFSNCEDYLLARETSFEKYLQWVRDHAKVSGLFYLDSATTVSDQRVAARVAEAVAHARPGTDLEATLARTSAPLVPRTAEPTMQAAMTGLRILAAIHDLRPLYPDASPRHDGAVLWRFARDCLPDLTDWALKGKFDLGSEFAALGKVFAEPLRWLSTDPPAAPAVPGDAPAWRPEDVQPGIADPHHPAIRHGLMALVRITDREQALAWLQAQRHFRPVSGCFVNVAVTFEGLQSLRVHPRHLAQLPREFVEGMERRAGLLGDVRSNHPQNWERPLDAHGNPIQFAEVDLVLQLRLVPDADDDVSPVAAQRRLADALATWTHGHGLEVLHTQPMASRDRDHLGFVDGISQPKIHGAGPHDRDRVPPGELFLGYPNSRDAGIPYEAHALLEGCSFMVARKLRIHFDRITACAQAAAKAAKAAGGTVTPEDVLERMIGRGRDGKPLVADGMPGADNDFSFRLDKAGSSCPFGSHVRRSNPRTESPALPVPRIARRGMSYGAWVRDDPASQAEDRGLVFVAYNASLAEQFEVIQRWLSGGNSSGASSDQDDPLLGVPVKGRSRVFKCFVGPQLVRVDLGDRPLVSLQWGLYALALSPKVLERLPTLVDAEAKAEHEEPPFMVPADAPGPVWRAALESSPTRAQAWRQVARHAGPVEAGDYARIVARPQDVREVLSDPGTRYSVRGYAARMAASTGVFHLGQDPQPAPGGPAQPAYAQAVNAAVAAHRTDEEAFLEAREIAQGAWRYFLAGAPNPDGSRTIDLRFWVARVVGGICQRWFGLPDAADALMGIGLTAGASGQPVCPGHFLMLSRSIFVSPADTPALAQVGQGQGQAVRAACRQWIEQQRAGSGEPRLADPVPKDRAAALSLETMRVLDAHHAGDEALASTLAGLMLGIAPTLMANAMGVLTRWSDSALLWKLRTQWLEGAIDNPAPLHARARQLLEPPLWSALVAEPVPYAVWRTDAQQPQRRVAVGLAAAAQQGPAHHRLIFGGDYRAGGYAHACPGQDMAIAQLLGLATVLMEVQGLRPGVSNKQVELVPPPPLDAPSSGAASAV